MANLAIGELASIEGRYAWAMLEMGIDYWDQGDRTLSVVAGERGLSTEDLCSMVQRYKPAEPGYDYLDLQGLCAVELIDHIASVQFSVLNEEMANLTRLIPQVLQRYGEQYHRLATTEVAFSQVRSELVSHIAQQRYVFFPAAREREQRSRQVGEKRSWTDKMAFRRDEMVYGLTLLRVHSDNFSEPPNGDLVWKSMVESLKRFTYCAYHHIYTLTWMLLPRLSHSGAN